MADITLQQLQTYADANGLTGAVDAANGTLDLNVLTGDTLSGTSGCAEPTIKLLGLLRNTAVSTQEGLDTYGAVSSFISPATDTDPAVIQSSATVNVNSPFNFDEAVAL